MPSSEPPERPGKADTSYPRSARFSELLAWHLTNGTRPNGSPSRIGKKWDNKSFGAALGDSEDGRAVRNWVGKVARRPNDIAGIERLLFGENDAYDQWRRHLRAAHSQHNEVVSLDGNSAPIPATPSPIEPRRAGRLPPRPQLKIFGRERIFTQLKHDLGVGAANASPTHITLHGMAGIGKSTVVNELAYEAELSEFFEDGVLWTSLGQRPRIMSELAAWGRSLGLTNIGRHAISHDAAQEIASCLSNKKVLLIIDDVWNSNDARPFIQAAGPNCRVLLTTRVPKVENEFSANNGRSVQLPLLDEHDGLALLSYFAHDVVAANQDECLELVRSLERHPLSLNVAGLLLKAEAGLGWSVTDLLNRLADGLQIIKEKPPSDVGLQSFASVEALLALTTNLLSAETLERFARLGPFAARPASFKVEAIKTVWRTDDPKPTIRELVSLGLLEPVGGRFQMHALLVAHAKSFLVDKH